MRHRKPWTCRWLHLHRWDCDPRTCQGDHRCVKCGTMDPLQPRTNPVPGGMHV